jgi:hypothetical protein
MRKSYFLKAFNQAFAKESWLLMPWQNIDASLPELFI